MQETLTSKPKIYSFYYTKNKSTPLFFKMSIVIIVCAIFMITLITLLMKHISDYNYEKNYFLLSLNYSSSKKGAETLQVKADENVGVSYVYEKGGVYHILGFIYDKEVEAKQILVSVKEKFPKAQILKIKKNKLKSKIYREIKGNTQLNNIYFDVNETKNIAFSLCKKIENGANLFDVYREIEKSVISLDKDFVTLSNLKQSPIVEQLKIAISVMLAYMRSCQDKIVVGENLIDNVKLLYMNLCFEDIELRKNLNKL